jgi:hypothetical protein
LSALPPSIFTLFLLLDRLSTAGGGEGMLLVMSTLEVDGLRLLLCVADGVR